MLISMQKLKMIIKTRELQEVSDHVDWEKLRDNYLTALYSEESSTRRNLKKRAPRARGKRKKNWNLFKMEKDLEQEASKAIQQANGIRKPTGDAKGAAKGAAKRTGGVNNALKAAQGAGKNPTKGSRGSDLPNSRAPKQRKEPPSSSPVAPVAPAMRASSPVAADPDVRAVDNNDEEFPVVMTTKDLDAAHNAQGGTTRQGDSASFNGKPMPTYGYDLGNCPGDGDSAAAVPCAPDNLPKICSKYDGDEGLLSLCLEACIPSFCCIHGKLLTRVAQSHVRGKERKLTKYSSFLNRCATCHELYCSKLQRRCQLSSVCILLHCMVEAS
jgi:hypothetical protein